jgi:hypothetical protein
MDKKMALVELIKHSAPLMDKREELGLEETESAILDEGAIQLLQSRFGATTDLRIFSSSMDNGQLWEKVNSELKMYLNSEINTAQPGRSASKWGVTQNGLALIISPICVAIE